MDRKKILITLFRGFAMLFIGFLDFWIDARKWSYCNIKWDIFRDIIERNFSKVFGDKRRRFCVPQDERKLVSYSSNYRETPHKCVHWVSVMEVTSYR